MRQDARGGLVAASENALDRVVAFFAPRLGLARMQARARMSLFGGYYGGARDRRQTRNWRPFARSANDDTLPDLRTLRARSRDLVRNMPIATGALATVVTSVVGDGLALKPAINRDRLGLDAGAARAWEQQAKAEFDIWCRHPDFTDRINFDEMQALVLRSALESGDVFVARRQRVDPGDVYGLKLQVIEADRISNPNFGANTATRADGVELDASGRPTGYWICNMHPQEFTLGLDRQWKLYDKGSSVTGSPLILHLYDVLRPDQARGVPYLAPVVEAIKQLGDYTEAEIRAAVVAAMFTVLLKYEDEPDPETPDIGSNDPAEHDVDKDTELALGNGAIVNLPGGAEAQFANPPRPNGNYGDFCTAFSRQIGVALELPSEVLLKSFTASYSASRAALEIAWQSFRRRRSWLAWKFCQPVYEWVIAEAVARGRLSAPGFFSDAAMREAWLGAEWVGPSRIQLDPQKEAAADLIDLQMATKTREQIAMERTGGSFESKLAQRAEEERQLRENGIATVSQGGAGPAAQQNSQDSQQ
jgi:lambda family phage portal protein